MLSDENEVEVDYDEPGSPLDRYLADFDLEFHPSAGLSQLENAHAGVQEQKNSSKEETSQSSLNIGPFLLIST